MSRIVTSVMVTNALNPERYIRCDALVDTGASHMVLPLASRERLGELDTARKLALETATQTLVEGEVCGPVKIQVEGFRPVYGEVLFVEMMPEDGIYEALLGYLVLEACPAAVDMIGHRLVPAKHLDLK